MMKKDSIQNILIIVIVIVIAFLIQLAPLIIIQADLGFNVLTLGNISLQLVPILIISGILLAIVFPLKYLVFKRIMRKGNTEEKQ